jgi:hypothetical protein
MYNKNLPLSEIGRYFNVSRQRIWQIIKPLDHKMTRFPHGTKPHERPEEEYIYNILLNKKFDVYKQDYNSPYDLLVNGKKVEIKYRSKADSHKTKGYSIMAYKFNSLKGKVPIDFYIFICGKIPNPEKIMIMPMEKVGSDITIIATPKNKQAKKRGCLYNLNWKLLQGIDNTVTLW